MTIRFLGSVSRAIALHPKSTWDLSTRRLRSCFNFFLSHEVETWLTWVGDEIEVNISTIQAITLEVKLTLIFDYVGMPKKSTFSQSHVKIMLDCGTLSTQKFFIICLFSSLELESCINDHKTFSLSKIDLFLQYPLGPQLISFFLFFLFFRKRLGVQTV